MHNNEEIGMAAGIMVVLTLLDKVGIDFEKILVPESDTAEVHNDKLKK